MNTTACPWIISGYFSLSLNRFGYEGWILVSKYLMLINNKEKIMQNNYSNEVDYADVH